MSEVPGCPFCRSVAVERISQWGGQIITSQWRCLECGSYYEAVREEFAKDSAGGSGATDSATSEK